MAYGDGGFFFTQPVGNGYSGVAYNSAAGMAVPRRRGFFDFFRGPTLADLEAQLARLDSQINKLRTQASLAPHMAASVSAPLQALMQKRARLARRIAARRARMMRKLGPLPFIPVAPPPRVSGYLDPTPLPMGTGPVPEGFDPMADEMTVMDEDLMEDESFIDRAREYAMDNPLITLIGAGALGYGGYRLYKRYRS